MADRPTDAWREDPEISARRPASLLSRIDEAMQAFETELAALGEPSDGQVLATVKRLVMTLNKIHFEDGAYFDTIDREELCDYIDLSLVEAGVDVDELAHRHQIDRAEITGQWRDW